MVDGRGSRRREYLRTRAMEVCEEAEVEVQLVVVVKIMDHLRDQVAAEEVHQEEDAVAILVAVEVVLVIQLRPPLPLPRHQCQAGQLLQRRNYRWIQEMRLCMKSWTLYRNTRRMSMASAKMLQVCLLSADARAVCHWMTLPELANHSSSISTYSCT